MAVPSRERQLVGNVWQYRTVEEGASPGGASPLRVLKATVGFADFVDQGGGLGRTALLYTLEPQEQLLWIFARVTETFDDSADGTGIFVSSASAGPFGSIVGQTVSKTATTANDGVVDLANATLGVTGFWGDNTSLFDPVEAESTALPLHAFANPLNFDGAAGIVEFTFYVATPTAL